MTLAVQSSVPRLRPDTFADLLKAVESRACEARAGLAAAANGQSPAPEPYVADLIHFLAILHGELPNVIDVVTSACPRLEGTLEPAAQQMQRDRAWLAGLCVETGSAVEHFGITEAETAVRGLRDAMLTLAGSQREGCGLGVAIGFLVEWPPLRTCLDQAGTLAFSRRWPGPDGFWTGSTLKQVLPIAETAFAAPTTGRAIAFGASQWTQVHSQLLALAEDRAAARGA